MVRSGSNCLANEAKWTEPIYDTVSMWMRRVDRRRNPCEGNSNRQDVLEGWLKLLAAQVNRELVAADFTDCIYQMVYRAASACYSIASPQLAYLLFTNSRDDHAKRSKDYWRALEKLHALLGNPTNFPFHFVEVQIKPTAAFDQLKNLLKGSPDTANAVQAALCNSKLFDFGSFQIHALVEARATARQHY
jgi:hypothetical protein